MNITTELPLASAKSARTKLVSTLPDELTQLKKELLQAEVRLARARATVSGAEVDVKVLNARLKGLGR